MNEIGSKYYKVTTKLRHKDMFVAISYNLA
jgi:hypothetical protein